MLKTDKLHISPLLPKMVLMVLRELGMSHIKWIVVWNYVESNDVLSEYLKMSDYLRFFVQKICLKVLISFFIYLRTFHT